LKRRRQVWVRRFVIALTMGTLVFLSVNVAQSSAAGTVIAPVSALPPCGCAIQWQTQEEPREVVYCVFLGRHEEDGVEMADYMCVWTDGSISYISVPVWVLISEQEPAAQEEQVNNDVRYPMVVDNGSGPEYGGVCEDC
jgi:hypothetical protein